MSNDRRNNRKPVEVKEFDEKIINISRVSKTVKGGRKISFSVMAAVGNKKGKVGIGLGKANGVPEAIKKAITNAKRNMIEARIEGTTLPHNVVGRFAATQVVMRPAMEGTGLKAGSSARDILDLVGVHNVVSKVLGSKNRLNVARATIEGLKELRSAEDIAAMRGKSVEEILG